MKEINIWAWILIDDLNRILLIKRKYDKKDYPNCWATPWWKKENDETIEEATIREVKEEVWLDFKIDSLFFEERFCLDWERNIFINRYLWKYKWEIKIQESECDWYWWFSFEETIWLNIYPRMRELIKNLYEKWLIK